MFNIEYVKDLEWTNAEHTSFKCVVKYVEFNEEHPTGVTPHDTYGHIAEIWKNGIAGLYGPIKEFNSWEGLEEYKPENLHMPVTVFSDTPQT